MPASVFTIEFGDSSDHGPCACCGNQSRTVWGYLFAGDRTTAVYYVQWTLTRVHDHGANFDFVIGNWGEGASAAQRSVVAAAFRLIDGEPQFMIIDAAGRPVARDGKLARAALRRDQVIGTPLASEVFDMIDAVWLGDDRIRELSGKSQSRLEKDEAGN